MILYNRFFIVLALFVIINGTNAMQRSRSLFPYTPQACYMTRLGSEQVSPELQSLWAQEQQGLGLNDIELRQMNQRTAEIHRHHNNPAFTMPFTRIIWVDEEQISDEDARYLILYHEVAHINYRHCEKRALEEHSVPLLAAGAAFCATVSRFIGKTSVCKKRWLQCSQLLATTGLGKIALDTTQWYQEKHNRWIRAQELQAHRYALHHHPHPERALRKLIADESS